MSPRFEVSCAAVHPMRCDVRLSATSAEHVLAQAREHGESAHGYTGAWYTTERRAAMATLVARHPTH